MLKNYVDALKLALAMINKGYVFYSFTSIPKHKEKHKQSIISKIESKFSDLGMKYYERARLKKKGQRIHKVIAFENNVLILATEGCCDYGDDPECFENIKEKPLEVKVSHLLGFKITWDTTRKRANVYLTKDAYVILRDELLQAVKHKGKKKTNEILKRIAKLPAFKGLGQQMEALRAYIRQKAGRDIGPIRLQPLNKSKKKGATLC